MIDGQHVVQDQHLLTQDKRQDYSALAPAGRNILKENLQQLQMFARDDHEDD